MNIATSLALENGFSSVNKRLLLARIIRAAQPISRTEIAERIAIDRSTVTEYVKPLIDAGVLTERTLETKVNGRRQRVLGFAEDSGYFIGVNIGVRHTQIGITTLAGEIRDEDEYATPSDPAAALSITRERIDSIIAGRPGERLHSIGVSVPGITDAARNLLLYAPNLDWRSVEIAKALDPGIGKVIVENDSAAAAAFEARLKIRSAANATMPNFILVRSGTGIGVGLVIGSEVYRGGGRSRGVAGEFGHMTIVAGGKPCVCGNRGCWEQYASAASAASLYIGNRPPRNGESLPRFVEIVSKARNGETRAARTLAQIGDYLGIGIANVIMGIGISHVIISGRLVYGWDLIKDHLNAAIARSIIGKTDGWLVEAGSPAGGAIGGALEVAVEDHLASL